MSIKPRLSGNFLKIIAAISMTIDHIGLMFFPDIKLFRILGRIALPIFAFMIAEGCRYTRNKLRYFLTIFLLAFACQAVYFIYDGNTYMSILVTFSISILNVYTFQFFKDTLYCKASSNIIKTFSAFLFIFTITSTFLINQILVIDYGFYGCILPLFASLFYPQKGIQHEAYNSLLTPYISVFSLAVGMLLLALDLKGNQMWSFIALPLLLCYSGKRGKYNIKYFFYIFYPAHLLLLEGVNMVL